MPQNQKQYQNVPTVSQLLFFLRSLANFCLHKQGFLTKYSYLFFVIIILINFFQRENIGRYCYQWNKLNTRLKSNILEYLASYPKCEVEEFEDQNLTNGSLLKTEKGFYGKSMISKRKKIPHHRMQNRRFGAYIPPSK